MAIEQLIEHKGSHLFTCAYVDPDTLVITPNMSFGSNDEFQSWNDCDPPFPGWWNAHFNVSEGEVLKVWRWWDGKYWSSIARPEFDEASVAIRARKRSNLIDLNPHLYEAIKWNDRWPVGARVPRVIPDGHPLQPLAGMIGGTVGEVGEAVDDRQLALPLDDKPLQQQLEESDW